GFSSLGSGFDARHRKQTSPFRNGDLVIVIGHFGPGNAARGGQHARAQGGDDMIESQYPFKLVESCSSADGVSGKNVPGGLFRGDWFTGGLFTGGLFRAHLVLVSLGTISNLFCANSRSVPGSSRTTAYLPGEYIPGKYT